MRQGIPVNCNSAPHSEQVFHHVTPERAGYGWSPKITITEQMGKLAKCYFWPQQTTRKPVLIATVRQISCHSCYKCALGGPNLGMAPHAEPTSSRHKRPGHTRGSGA